LFEVFLEKRDWNIVLFGNFIENKLVVSIDIFYRTLLFYFANNDSALRIMEKRIKIE